MTTKSSEARVTPVIKSTLFPRSLSTDLLLCNKRNKSNSKFICISSTRDKFNVFNHLTKNNYNICESDICNYVTRVYALLASVS